MANQAVEYIRDVWDSIIHAKKNKKNKSDAVSEINDFINDYHDGKIPQKESLPDAPKYERMEYDAPDDDAIRKSAEDELAAYKAQGEKKIESEITELEKKYNADLQSAKSARDEAEEKTSGSYAKAKQSVNDDMLKRGLARSSIAANKSAALDGEEAAAKAKLYAEFTKQADELNAKISELGVKREAALNDFDISYAARLTERINELKESRDKSVAEALKYNNSLAEKEYEARVDKQMKESDLYSEALSQRQKENALKETTQVDYMSIYNQIAERLRTINKNDARDIVLHNPNVRESVGSTFYYKLYDEFCR